MPEKNKRALWPWVIAALVLLAAYASTWVELRSGDPRRPGSAESILAMQDQQETSVLFILIDTLRAGRLGCYGYERDTSPTLDYMAQTGVRFDRQLAQSSWTKCSMASLWTGLNPARTGILSAEHATPVEATMPAEILQEAGFRTAGVWRNGWVAPNFGFGQGFEVYERPMPAPVPASVRRDHPQVSLDGTDLDIVDTAIEFLNIHGRERWFLYLHLMDVHQYLYDMDSARFGSTYEDIYDNSVLHTDGIVGRLLTYLAERDLLQKTLVVVASDHGEAFMERGYEGHASHIYPESTEVPLILGFPFLLEPSVVIESRTRNIDIWPTILDLLGLPALPDTDGRSLLPEILAAVRGQVAPREAEPAVAHLDRNWGTPGSESLHNIALEDGGFRFIRTASRGAPEISEELFHRVSDPEEMVDVTLEYPEVAKRLGESVDAYLESEESPWGVEAPAVSIDEMELNQLRALGYALP